MLHMLHDMEGKSYLYSACASFLVFWKSFAPDTAKLAHDTNGWPFPSSLASREREREPGAAPLLSRVEHHRIAVAAYLRLID